MAEEAVVATEEGVAVEATAEEAEVDTEEVVVAVEATVEAVAVSAETGCRTLAIA
jgi:hypothetical protein